MVFFDECHETDGDNEWKAWLEQVFDAKQEIIDFASSRRTGNCPLEFDSYLKGSFNFGLSIQFNDGGPKTLIRFPKPGHTATTLRDEKVTNEVSFLNYLGQNTRIPVTRVTSWGMTEENPQKLGPYIIMDFVEGTRSTNIMMMANEDPRDDFVLDPKIYNAKLGIYDQIADYIIQLSRLNFDAIGAISQANSSSSKTWTVTGRPLTYNMNELATYCRVFD
ncbi:hypothetical protein K505DRAFT_334577 [Melanomma pulvis-pyrius CBS 109.77]|uniref:Aminoglycoside phosphotransferase domain-containing protein n=1 Tax=Melanomma pulvis-pyrius CBS 109.77 TaxID=1314802 RepID=A0A6A6XL23_9PLEO|nr:hypothetical protein K505DRAFT_334577 [Melanomma pulvis-pyrius CBS 109.77]